MTLRTILAHLTHESSARAILAPAVGLARAHGAHLIGITAAARMQSVPTLGLPYSGTIAEQVRVAQEAQDRKLQEIFTAATAGEAFVAEWVSVAAGPADLAAAVLEHGRAADLVVAGQRDEAWDLAPVLDFPERLALEGGRPVLVVPGKGASEPRAFEKVAIAWKGTREAARAVFDALPILQSAREVVILTVGEAQGRRLPAGTPATAIAASLARHGIGCDVQEIPPGERSVGQAIVAEARSMGCDLIVMGAYGHSRLRELVFGGVTRELVSAVPVPLLISH